MKKNIVIKIGSNLLTDQKGALKEQIIKNLVQDIFRIKKNGFRVVLISSGAVSAGRLNAKLRAKFKITNETSTKKEIVRKQILASIGQPRIVSIYNKAFAKFAIDCAQILVNKDDFSDREKYLNIRNLTFGLLDLNIVPIFNENDVLLSHRENFSDNDELGAVVSAMLIAEELIILTNVDGVFDKDPQQAKAKIIPKIKDVKKILEKTKFKTGILGRGGIKSKLKAADLAKNLGISTTIANGNSPNILEKIVLKNEKNGTFIPGGQKKIKPLKSWMASAARPQGKIYVSTYLADILKNKKTASILLNGVEKMEGVFEKKAIVEILDLNKKILGKGQIKISSKSLKNKLEKKERSCDKNKIVIHYDQFVYL